MVDWKSGEERAGEGLTHHIDYCGSVMRVEKKRQVSRREERSIINL